MDQQRPTKRKKKAYAKPGSLSYMANRKRRLLTTNETIQAIRSEKEHLLKLIDQQPVAPQSDANEQPTEEQHVEEQQSIDVQEQMDSTTPPTNEHSEEQEPSHIPECQFKELLKYWKSEKFKEKERGTVSLKEMFVATRARKSRHSHKAEMEEIEAQASVDGQSVDAFSTVMDPEHPVRLRLYGGGLQRLL